MHFQLLPPSSHLSVSLTYVPKLELNSDDQSHCWLLSFCCLSSLMSSLNAARRPPWGGSRQISCAYTPPCSSNPAKSSVVLQPTAHGHLLEETKYKKVPKAILPCANFPDKWTVASTVPLLKVNDPYNTGNYWSISAADSVTNFQCKTTLSSAQAQGWLWEGQCCTRPGLLYLL